MPILRGPERSSDPEDGTGRKWPEVPTVQRSGAVGIEQKNLIGGECLAAAPDGQRATPSIPTEGLTYHDAVDGDGAITPADALPWKGREDRKSTRLNSVPNAHL